MRKRIKLTKSAGVQFLIGLNLNAKGKLLRRIAAPADFYILLLINEQGTSAISDCNFLRDADTYADDPAQCEFQLFVFSS